MSCRSLAVYFQGYSTGGKVISISSTVQYTNVLGRGVKEALNANDIEVITASVPASGSVEKRAETLAHSIESKSRGRSVNIVA